MPGRPPTSATPLVQEAWRRCAERLLPPLPTGLLEQLFHHFIYDHYTEPQRHYHNMQHVEDMLDHLRVYETEHGWHGDYAPALVEKSSSHDESTEPRDSRSSTAVQHDWVGTVLLLSILFHDAVYDARRGDNEEKSAELARSFLKKAEELYETARDGPAVVAASGVPSPALLWSQGHEAVQFVRTTTNDYILKTKVHLSVLPGQPLLLAQPPTPRAIIESHDNPLHVFLDLDLAILGTPNAGLYHSRYAANIQREYSHYPPADFIKGRAAFLGGFLSSPQWYKTPFFFARLEAQARRNTAAELTELRARLAKLEEAASRSNL